MRPFTLLVVLIASASALGPLDDPSNYVNLASDTSDNAIIADYNVEPIMYLISPLNSKYTFTGPSSNPILSRQTLTSTSNDTDVILVYSGASLDLSYSDILKSGFSSNLLQASFGLNAAINVQNASTATPSHLNVTTHNGAANIYAYGTGTVVNITHSDLYSSGPVAHGLYASGNGTIYGSNIRHYSGGNRCSSFSGDNPAGYNYVSDSVAHTAGIGSAIGYALGTISATNILGLAEKAPAMFMDRPQTASWTSSDLTAGLLAGVVIFCSQTRQSGAVINFTDTRLTTLGDDLPGLWFGNTIATANLRNVELNTASGILAVANYSQVTQDFDYFAGYVDNPKLAFASINLAESDLVGDIVAFNGSAIAWSLSKYSTWTGKAYSGFGNASFGVHLDKTSKWVVTGNTRLANLTSGDESLRNVESEGFNVEYNSSSGANGWLGGRTVRLRGGRVVKPY